MKINKIILLMSMIFFSKVHASQLQQAIMHERNFIIKRAVLNSAPFAFAAGPALYELRKNYIDYDSLQNKESKEAKKFKNNLDETCCMLLYFGSMYSASELLILEPLTRKILLWGSVGLSGVVCIDTFLNRSLCKLALAQDQASDQEKLLAECEKNEDDIQYAQKQLR